MMSLLLQWSLTRDSDHFHERRHFFEGDAELFSCLTIDVVFTVTAKTEQDIVELSYTVIVGSIVTMVENVENTKLPSCHWSNNVRHDM